MSKYHNRKTEIDGIIFASLREAGRYQELKLLEKAGQIRDLMLQVKFPIVINGEKVCVYVADFVYWDYGKGKRVVEDCKGFRNRVYLLKKKLIKAVYQTEIFES